MKVLELFSGKRSIGKAFQQKGHQVFSIDYCEEFQANLHEDIQFIDAERILKEFGRPDVIWASPDCTTYSVAAFRFYRKKLEDGTLVPTSEYAKKCDRVNRHVMELIKELQPKYFFIENPRGGFRKMDFVKGIDRYTVTYCQYGDTRMKPTDIFTNYPQPNFKPPCKNGAPCHMRAPRGSKAGTQGIIGAKYRSVIPVALCRYIVEICQKGIENNG